MSFLRWLFEPNYFPNTQAPEVRIVKLKSGVWVRLETWRR